MKKENLLPSGTRVKVHSLGDGKIGYGTVCGVYTADIHPNFAIYIVWMAPSNPWKDYMNGYTCITVPNVCLSVV